MQDSKAITNYVNGSTLNQLTEEQKKILKNTVAKGATDDEFSLFIAVCNRTGLDPFTHQIHFVKRRNWNKEKKGYEEIGSIQTGIDGYRVIASRKGEHAGTDDAIFEEKDGMPTKATVTVYRMVGGQKQSFTASARFSEYAQRAKKENGDEYLMGMWARMPFSQLAKCAESLALRKAFPNDLSGLYTDEEASAIQVQEAPKGTRMKEKQGKVVEVDVVKQEGESVNVNNKKNRICILMKQAGIAPTENTSEGWEEAVKSTFDVELIEENFDKIIDLLSALTNPQKTTV